uniref:Uncharacterized protein n=1 Tax=Glossina pallidipes TaxID=7398 RepID=A0A1A9ZMH1_GLOPL
MTQGPGAPIINTDLEATQNHNNMPWSRFNIYELYHYIELRKSVPSGPGRQDSLLLDRASNVSTSKTATEGKASNSLIAYRRRPIKRRVRKSPQEAQKSLRISNPLRSHCESVYQARPSRLCDWGSLLQFDGLPLTILSLTEADCTCWDSIGSSALAAAS